MDGCYTHFDFKIFLSGWRFRWANAIYPNESNERSTFAQGNSRPSGVVGEGVDVVGLLIGDLCFTYFYFHRHDVFGDASFTCGIQVMTCSSTKGYEGTSAATGTQGIFMWLSPWLLTDLNFGPHNKGPPLAHFGSLGATRLRQHLMRW